jgi:protein-S-isoprenylcysteine O-methyltransferase Ste14
MQSGFTSNTPFSENFSLPLPVAIRVSKYSLKHCIMALREEFESSGNWLFKRRSWIPLLLFIPALLVVFYDPKEWLPFTNIFWSLGCLLVSMLGMAFRVWAIGHAPKGTSGRNTKQGQIAEKLNTSGVYSLVRHPLYLGNFLMWIGVILYTGHTLLLVVAVAFFWIYYERIMFAEEAFIKRKFGTDFTSWAAITPAFIPRLYGYITPELTFSVRNVLKREYTGFTLTMISFSLINFMKHWSYNGKPFLDMVWQMLLPFSLVLYFTLRSLKKHTTVLNVEGR